jgi:4-amino-4-deoxy-L-arabinose transferase-like glycosyltransferase
MQLIDTGPSVALTTLSCWLVLRAWLNPVSFKRYALAGVALALATLTRPVAAIFTVLLGLSLGGWFLWHRHPRHALVATSALWLAWGLLMSPWWLRNYVAYQHFIPLTTHGGVNILKGHTPNYTGVHPDYDTDHYPYFETVNLSNDPGGVQTDEIYKERALSYVIDHPVQAISTDIHKIVWLYGWHKVPRSFVDSTPRWNPIDQTVVDDGNPRPAYQDILYSLYWVPVLVLFLVGICCSRHAWRRYLPLYVVLFANALSVALAFADTRYRLEVDSVIAVWAAYGTLTIGGMLLQRFPRLRSAIAAGQSSVFHRND